MAALWVPCPSEGCCLPCLRRLMAQQPTCTPLPAPPGPAASWAEGGGGQIPFQVEDFSPWEQRIIPSPSHTIHLPLHPPACQAAGMAPAQCAGCTRVPLQGPARAHCVQPGLPVSLQLYRVQVASRAEVCLSAGHVSLAKVGTYNSIPKGLRAPSAPTAEWELVPLLSLLCPGRSQVQHSTQALQSQTLCLGPSSHGLEYVSPTVPADVCSHAGPCLGEQRGGQLALCVSALHAALARG